MKTILFVLMVLTPSGAEKQMFSKKMSLEECNRMMVTMTSRRPGTSYYCKPVSE